MAIRRPPAGRAGEHEELHPMSTASVNGITVGYDDTGGGDGDRDPLVLVHGHPFDRTMWRPQVEHFGATGVRVITPDLRGYGESTVVPGKTPLETFARDISALLDHLRIERIVLGGLSMGGQIVMEFHRLFPHRISGLLLADTSAQAETSDGVRRRARMAERLVREGMGPYADEVLPRMVAPANVRAMPAVARHVLGMMRATSPDGAAAALRGRAERPDYVATLSRVAVPALVVVGDRDEFTPISDARLMHERLPDSTLVVVEGAGHMPNLERPAAFNDALAALLARA
jgi:pimeloyl-ACP methyl ester carboxylesterase